MGGLLPHLRHEARQCNACLVHKARGIALRHTKITLAQTTPTKSRPNNSGCKDDLALGLSGDDEEDI
ncbi:hypothetical protein CDL12_02747 [Handroanthus impetiginosus]|uniref:Uncharacterized protein n=1 Tax=Handroanthus impetiginosus TaxID=429701 RepID=A0A2G9I431_9LAMI|nr:hypothetical protein CDL12_02747 [Handroanthus impetiginosus]